MPKAPEWMQYWRGLIIFPRRKCKCFVCGDDIDPSQAMLIKKDRVYCHNCANLLYLRIREDLSILNKHIYQIAEALGHSLGEFRPGSGCDPDHAVMVTECGRCQATVCYEVVDLIHNHNLGKHHPIVIHEPLGFPMKYRCPIR